MATQQSRLTSLINAIGADVKALTDGKQPLDSDLTAIAALSPTNDDFIQRKSGVWVNRTMAQLKTDLVLVKADVGLGNVDNTSDATKNAASAVLTNKRITPRAVSFATSATPSIDTGAIDVIGFTAQATDISISVTGTPTDGQLFWVYIVGTASRAITWSSSFEAGEVPLPWTTVGTTRLDVGFIWNAATSKWRAMYCTSLARDPVIVNVVSLTTAAIPAPNSSGANTELFATPRTTRMTLDLAKYNQVRLTSMVTALGNAATAAVKLSYMTTDNATWSGTDAGVSVVLGNGSVNTVHDSGWQTLAAAARIDGIRLAILVSVAFGTTAPSISNLVLQFRS